jgi:hypothetical protein
MHILKPQKIQSKFITGLVAAVLLLGTLSSIGSYYHLRSVLEAEVRDKARLIFMHVDGIQHYVRDTLRPVMYERIPESFIIQHRFSRFDTHINSQLNSLPNYSIYSK